MTEARPGAAGASPRRASRNPSPQPGAAVPYDRPVPSRLVLSPDAAPIRDAMPVA